MSRTVCFIDKETGQCGTCSKESMGLTKIDCNECNFKKSFEGQEEKEFSYCAWKGNLNTKNTKNKEE